MHTNPSNIQVREGLERFRKDLGDLEELAMSIKTHGQIQPIVVNKEMELLAGGRRLAACALYQMDVEYKVIDESDDLAMREIEVEENIQRKDFTPAEQVLAVKQLHEIKQKITVRDRDGKWTQQDTAEIIGVERSKVAKDLELAELIEAFPELASCKTKAELSSAGNAIVKLIDRAEGLEEYTKTVEESDSIEVYNQDMSTFMSNIPDNSVDILLTDPPYGIDIADQAIGKGGETGSRKNNQGFVFDDSSNTALSIVRYIALESFRFCKETAHAYVFCAPEFFNDVYNAFKISGWQPWIRPIIWCKPGQGQSNMPDRWPVVSYEMCLYARRVDSKLLYARPDTIQANRVPPKSKIHPTQKPVDLLQELITRSVRPGSTLVDPCMGSGSSLVAGIRESLIVKGCDVSKSAYTAALEFINSEVQNETSG